MVLWRHLWLHISTSVVLFFWCSSHRYLWLWWLSLCIRGFNFLVQEVTAPMSINMLSTVTACSFCIV